MIHKEVQTLVLMEAFGRLLTPQLLRLEWKSSETISVLGTTNYKNMPPTWKDGWLHKCLNNITNKTKAGDSFLIEAKQHEKIGNRRHCYLGPAAKEIPSASWPAIHTLAR